MEHLSSLRYGVSNIWERVVPRKYGMAALMIALKEAEIKSEDIPVHIQQGQTAKK